MVNENAPSATVAGISRLGDPALAKQFGGERINGKRHHKERHAAVG